MHARDAQSGYEGKVYRDGVRRRNWYMAVASCRTSEARAAFGPQGLREAPRKGPGPQAYCVSLVSKLTARSRNNITHLPSHKLEDAERCRAGDRRSGRRAAHCEESIERVVSCQSIGCQGDATALTNAIQVDCVCLPDIDHGLLQLPNCIMACLPAKNIKLARDHQQSVEKKRSFWRARALSKVVMRRSLRALPTSRFAWCAWGMWQRPQLLMLRVPA